MPPKDSIPVIDDEGGAGGDYATSDSKEPNPGKQGKTSNPKFGVGGTAKDGGMSTADTVADGGEDEAEEDEEFKPS